jgi:WD40 repeat protein
LINEIESKIQKKDYSNVIELCDKAMELELNSPILYIYKGNSLYKLKQYEDALKCYDAALEINPQNYEALNNKRKIIQEQTNKIEGETLQDHSDNVNSVAITSDNKKIVSGSNDKTIKIWDIDTGEVLKTLIEHSDNVNSVAITSDNKKIVSGSNKSTISISDIDTCELLKTLIGHSHYVKTVAITPDNKKIVSGSGDRTIKVWQILI